MQSHSIKTLIKNSEKIELTGEQLHNITEGKCRIVAYEALEDFQNIDQCFQGFEGLIILYQKDRTDGHWTLLMRRSENLLEFFDPYGLKLDSELRFSDYNLRRHKGEMIPHLSALIDNSDYKLIQNTVQLQKLQKDYNTCGRWVGVRFLMREFSLNKFVKLFEGVDSDYTISSMTILYSNFD